MAMAAAVAARKLGRPVRVMLDRDEDMLMTGHRNPFMAKYKVGFNKDGIIKAVDVDLVRFYLKTENTKKKFIFNIA